MAEQAKTYNYMSKFEFSHHPPLSGHATFSPHRLLEPYTCLVKTHAQQHQPATSTSALLRTVERTKIVQTDELRTHNSLFLAHADF
jgi:hypothetical protein